MASGDRVAAAIEKTGLLSGGLLPIAIPGAAMAANGEQLLIEAAGDPPRVDLVQSGGESEEGLAEGEVAGLTDCYGGLSLVREGGSGGFKSPGWEEGGGGRLGTERRIGSSGGGVAGAIPGVAGSVSGVARSILGVAESILGVALSIPGGGSGETTMVQVVGASGWEGSLRAVVWVELERRVGVWDVGWTWKRRAWPDVMVTRGEIGESGGPPGPFR